MPDFLETTLCRKDEYDADLIGFCIVLKSEGHPEGDPINMTRTEAFVYLLNTPSSLKCVRLSLDSLYTPGNWCRMCVNQHIMLFTLDSCYYQNYL